MAISLDNAFVAPCLQVLNSLNGLVSRAEAHCAEQGLAPEALTSAQLAPDMFPFAKQITAAAHHSAGAIAGVRAGVFGPRLDAAPTDFASLHQEVEGAIAALQAMTPGELDAIAERDTCFEFGTTRMDFTVEDFLMSFSLPNFFFHTTTAYAILRNQGLGIGKRDFLGRVRIKS